MPTILITGGTGFVASHLLEALIQKGETNVHLTSYKDDGAFIKTLVDETKIHQINLANYNEVETLIEELKPEQIYHLASIASVGDSFEKKKFVLEMNLSLQLNLIDAILKHAPQSKLLHISTALVYAPSNAPLDEKAALGPENPYGLSKLAQDLLTQISIKSEGLNAVVIRPFNHIGERQATGFVIADLAKAIVEIENGQKESLQVGNLSSVRDFSDVKDMVQAYILLMEKGQRGEIYNIGSGVGKSIQEMLDLLVSLAKKEISVHVDPQKIRPIDLPHLVCDNEKISKLGWQPTQTIQDTLERILNYWRNNV